MRMRLNFCHQFLRDLLRLGFVSLSSQAAANPDNALIAQGLEKAAAASWESIVARMRKLISEVSERTLRITLSPLCFLVSAMLAIFNVDLAKWAWVATGAIFLLNGLVVRGHDLDL